MSEGSLPTTGKTLIIYGVVAIGAVMTMTDALEKGIGWYYKQQDKQKGRSL